MKSLSLIEPWRCGEEVGGVVASAGVCVCACV